MTIAAGDALVSGPYTGDGVADTFDYDFLIFAGNQLTVQRQIISSGAISTVDPSEYTVAPTGGTYPAKGTVTFGVAPPNTVKIVIAPAIPLSQERPFTSQDTVTLEEIENALDKATALVRQNAEALERTVKVDVFNTIDVDTLTNNVVALGAITAEMTALAAVADDIDALGPIAADITTVADGMTAGSLEFDGALRAVGTLAVFPDTTALGYGAKFTVDGSDNLILTRERYDGGAAASWAQIDVPGSTAASSAATLMRRDQGDARYLQLAGGTTTGRVTMAMPTELIPILIQTRASDNIADISFRDNAGGLDWRWDFRATATSVGGVQLRHNNVALFNLASTGSITLAGSSGAFISGTGGVVSNGEIQTRTDGNNSLGFRKAAGPINGLLYFNRAGATADVPGKLTVNYYDEDGTDARVAATIENPISKGGTLAAANSVVTREHGDVRYVLDQDAVKQVLTIFNGDLDTLVGPGETRTYQVGTSATNSPAAVNGSLFVQQHPTLGNFVTQTFIEQSSVSPRQWFRARSSGVWSTWQLLASGSGTSGLLTEQATTSGTAFDFTGIPAGVREVELILGGVSLSSTDHFLVQIGDSGGLETTGYDSASQGGGVVVASTTGFLMRGNSGPNAYSGSMKIKRMNGNKWVADHTIGGAAGCQFGGGVKTLSGELDRVRLTRTGTNTFDAGAVNVRWLAA